MPCSDVVDAKQRGKGRKVGMDVSRFCAVFA